MDVTQETGTAEPNQADSNGSKGREPIHVNSSIPERLMPIQQPEGNEETSGNLQVPVNFTGSLSQVDNENKNSSQSFPGAQSLDSDSEGNQSKTIVIYFKGEGGCNPHKFASRTKTEYLLGKGAYGEVFKVECTVCHKVSRFPF